LVGPSWPFVILKDKLTVQDPSLGLEPEVYLFKTFSVTRQSQTQ